MLDQTTRRAIRRLRETGHGTRTIARALGISRGAVKHVRRDGSAAVPPAARPEKGTPHRERILELYAACKGNLVRVHEELCAAGAPLSYPALTAFCRRHGIGHAPPAPAGQYHFAPGQAMQHDTSPHDVMLGGTRRRVQTASLVVSVRRSAWLTPPRPRRRPCATDGAEDERGMGEARRALAAKWTHGRTVCRA
jgi:hypothetical protein